MPLTLRFQTTGRVPGNARPVEMRGQNLTVGRSPDNDLVLPDPDRTISKRHCVLEERSGQFVVIDISSNGTFLNYSKEPLGPELQPVHDGDILSIGPYELIVSIAAAAGQGADLPPAAGAPMDPGAMMPGGMPPAAMPPGPSMTEMMPTDNAGDLLDDLLSGPGTSESEPVPGAGSLGGGGLGGGGLGGGLGGGSLGGGAGGGQLIPDDADDDLLGGLPGLPPEPPRAAPAPYTPPSQGAVAGQNFQPSAPSGGLIPDDWDLEIGGADDAPPDAAAPERPSGGPFGAPPSTPVEAGPPPGQTPEPRAVETPSPPPSSPPPSSPPPPSPLPPAPAAEDPAAEAPVAEGTATDLPATPPPPPSSDAPVAPEPAPAPADPGIGGAPDAPAAAPAPIPPAPATPAPATPASTDAARAFLESFGVADLDVPDDELEAVMARLGTTMRALIVGVREILMTRTAIKGEFRMGQTVIRRTGNNPLKFSITEEEAVARIAGPPAKGYMDPDAAVEEALRDIRAHEIAMVSGMQAALAGLLAEFDPAVLSAKLAESGRAGGLLKSKKTQYWEVFEETYAAISDQAENDFHELFTREFAQAYQSQLEKLK